MSRKIVFLGGGNMAEGILRAMVSSGAFSPEDVTMQEILPARCEYLEKTYGVKAAADAGAAAASADMVIVAVVPSLVGAVAEPLKDIIGRETVIMSIAAGATVEALEGFFGAEKKILRMMPNVLNQVGVGYSAVVVNQNITDEDRAFAKAVADTLGTTKFIQEEQFDIFTSFCSTGPLWVYKFVEAMIDAGVYVGFGRQEARDMVLKNLTGVARLLEETGEHPVAKVDAMTSPAGITIEALAALQKSGFASDILDSIVAATKKAKGE